MNYKLVIELRDAGFPLKLFRHVYKSVSFKDGHGLKVIHVPGKAGDSYLHPTLSELIEECGDGFGTLERLSRDQWVCDSDIWYETPKEAVARLWLALNKKNAPEDAS